jgi:cyclopropane fatty-acyl-phospholipid synthase-like methyltransferase
MLHGRERVLEIGCADAFGSRLVSKEVGWLVCSDFDTKFLEEVRAREEPWGFETLLWNPCKTPIEQNDFDGVYALDVLEHIGPSQEEAFLGNIGRSLTNHGILILGSPSLESQSYASAPSKAGHVNCKTEDDLRNSCKRFFETVFIFGMNDEVLTTGFGPMCHYRFAICVSPKSR